MQGFLAMPGFRAAWRVHAQTFVPEFRAWMDAMMRETQFDVGAVDRVEAWKALCREELGQPGGDGKRAQ